ncbi:MAG: class I SAM-dependent methyltransferase [Vampirovibrionales bacterium]|nr:class I SAM-dependent methyltransferase [Vampirovibrionales bacterium]
MAVKNLMINAVRAVARCAGLEISRALPLDIEPEAIALLRQAKPYTMTSMVSLYSLYQAVGYVVRNAIPGALVECGVWRGGSAMAMALTLLRLGIRDRDLYLFDTFEGMTEPGEQDVSKTGESAYRHWQARQRHDGVNEWCLASLEDVRRTMAASGYPIERIHLIRGRVEETLPSQAPEQIALLRLDTDWYESTRHELMHLYPRLSGGGALIIDDYGEWRGARQAVDEYLQAQNAPLLLHRIDHTGRIALKPLGVARTQETACHA